VGIDSNDLGYYSNVGRGAAVASVEVAGKTLFKTQPLHEGMAGVPIHVDLNGASGFDLKVEDGGGGVVLRTNFDSTDWADARVTMADGTVVGLGDLPLGPLPGAISIEAPFSFRYADWPSSYLLKTWDLTRATRQLDENRTEHTLVYTDPQTGLVVRAVAIEYRDFPVASGRFTSRTRAPSPHRSSKKSRRSILSLNARRKASSFSITTRGRRRRRPTSSPMLTGWNLEWEKKSPPGADGRPTPTLAISMSPCRARERSSASGGPDNGPQVSIAMKARG
jgi:hypothetical protein